MSSSESCSLQLTPPGPWPTNENGRATCGMRVSLVRKWPPSYYPGLTSVIEQHDAGIARARQRCLIASLPRAWAPHMLIREVHDVDERSVAKVSDIVSECSVPSTRVVEVRV